MSVGEKLSLTHNSVVPESQVLCLPQLVQDAESFR